jgi:transcription termination/antitermination protein NusG
LPRLKREPELFPEGIFGLPELDYPWWVAHTLSRQDKALARYLMPLGVPFYLPSREQRTRRAARTLVSYLPLFPGYLFFRGSAAHRRAALRSNLIIKVLEVMDQDVLTGELLQIRRLQELGADLVPYRDLAPGDPVGITDGPFKGYKGVVLRQQGRLRLLVSISMLRQAVAVEFERNVVVPERHDSANRQRDRSAAAS